MKFKDLAPGAIFKIARGQGSVLFGWWVKDEKENVMSNAHKKHDGFHRAYVGPNLEVIAEGDSGDQDTPTD